MVEEKKKSLTIDLFRTDGIQIIERRQGSPIEGAHLEGNKNS